MRSVTTCLVVAAAVALLGACNEVGNVGNTCESTGGVPVEATDDSAFVPASVQIQPTQKVCWQNLGSLTHTITASLASDSIDITLPPTFTFTRAFGVVRDFNYFCRFHGEQGVVQVR